MSFFSEVFGTVKPYVYRVGEKDLNFYPISPKLLKEFKSLSIPLSDAFASFMMKPESVSGVSQEDFTDTKDGQVVHKFSQPALSVEAATFITARRRDAVKVIAEFFLDGHNHTMLARMIMNSLKDDFPNRNPQPKDLDEFLEAADIKTLLELIKGTVFAHKDMLGPFIEPLKGALKDLNLLANPQGNTLSGS